CLINHESGSYNTGVGTFVLSDNTSGTHNTALGVNAQQYNNSSYNIAVGFQALRYTKGERNVAIGNLAMGTANFSTAQENVAIGDSASFNNGSSYTTAVGIGALKNNLDVSDGNTAIGYHSLFSTNQRRNT